VLKELTADDGATEEGLAGFDQETHNSEQNGQTTKK